MALTSKNETILELWRAQERHCYFMMSGAGASIGYAITKIGSTVDEGKLRLLLVALLVWGASFICGYYSLKYRRGSMAVNIMKLDEERLLPSQDYEKKQKLREVVKGVLEKTGKKLDRIDTFQVWFLILGAAIFVSSQLDFEVIFRPLKSLF
ncbi:MAG: hypothetical protein Q8O82_10215 [Pseudorhodobacter sp.]|nr:hypothetical protein [Pseudorhodobacter sp.]